MALFQRNDQFSDSKPFFTLSLSKTFLIVGLGNVGREFDGTRHNIGFDCVDELVSNQSELSDWQNKKDLKVHFSVGQFNETRVIVIKPTTLMNLSGEAVVLVSNFYKISPANIVIVHDELDIDFGQIRTRVGGGSAGHNGIKSVISSIGEGFGRVRIGIGPKTPDQIDSADFVLGKFSKSLASDVNLLKKEVVSMLVEYIYSGQLNEETRSFLIK